MKTRKGKLIDGLKYVVSALNNQILSTYKRFDKTVIPTVNCRDLLSGLHKLNADELQALNDILLYSSISISEYRMALNAKIMENTTK
jgi:hypothetical protein